MLSLALQSVNLVASEGTERKGARVTTAMTVSWLPLSYLHLGTPGGGGGGGGSS